MAHFMHNAIINFTLAYQLNPRKFVSVCKLYNVYCAGSVLLAFFFVYYFMQMRSHIRICVSAFRQFLGVLSLLLSQRFWLLLKFCAQTFIRLNKESAEWKSTCATPLSLSCRQSLIAVCNARNKKLAEDVGRLGNTSKSKQKIKNEKPCEWIIHAFVAFVVIRCGLHSFRLWETTNTPFKYLHIASNYEQDSHTISNMW